MPVFLLGKSHIQRSHAGYSPWGHKRVGQDLATKQGTDIIYIALSYDFHVLCVSI